ncbi:hypothetical protein ACFE04_016035 [Oxalis oulophora]
MITDLAPSIQIEGEADGDVSDDEFDAEERSHVLRLSKYAELIPEPTEGFLWKKMLTMHQMEAEISGMNHLKLPSEKLQVISDFSRFLDSWCMKKSLSRFSAYYLCNFSRFNGCVAWLNSHGCIPDMPAILAGAFAKKDYSKETTAATRVLQMSVILGLGLALVVGLVMRFGEGIFSKDVNVLHIIATAIPMAMVTIEKKLPPVEVYEQLSNTLTGLLPALLGLSDIIPKETIVWKLKLLSSTSAYTNSRLHAVKAEAKACSLASIARLKNLNRRIVDVLAARLYLY